MRLFFDTNLLTYIAFFEGFLIEGQREIEAELLFWERHQGRQIDEKMFLEIDALRKLYALDRVAHFTFLFSDLALDEISRIKSIIKQNTHSSLLHRLIEHRHDVYLEEGRNGIAVDRDRCFATFSSTLPEKMHNDGRQYAESVVVEADYFLTNDEKFLRRLPGISSVIACRPSKLAFLNRN